MKVLRIGFILCLLVLIAEGEGRGEVPLENPHWLCLTSDRSSVFFRPGYESLAAEASDAFLKGWRHTHILFCITSLD